MSGDEDLFQLVNDRVRVLKPSRAGSDGETLCDADKVKEIIGVEPAQVVDWLALTGDPSDNIPGARPLPGQEPPLAEGEKKRSYIGPKGATELIQQFGTLEKALENYEQVKKQSYRDALRDFRRKRCSAASWPRFAPTFRWKPLSRNCSWRRSMSRN